MLTRGSDRLSRIAPIGQGWDAIFEGVRDCVSSYVTLCHEYPLRMETRAGKELGEPEPLGARLPGRGADARPWHTLHPANGPRAAVSGPLPGLSARIPFPGTPDA